MACTRTSAAARISHGKLQRRAFCVNVDHFRIVPDPVKSQSVKPRPATAPNGSCAATLLLASCKGKACANLEGQLGETNWRAEERSRASA